MKKFLFLALMAVSFTACTSTANLPATGSEKHGRYEDSRIRRADPSFTRIPVRRK